MEQNPEAFFRVHEGLYDRRPSFNHILGNISFFKIDELGLVGQCADDHSFRI